MYRRSSRRSNRSDSRRNPSDSRRGQRSDRTPRDASRRDDRDTGRRGARGDARYDDRSRTRRGGGSGNQSRRAGGRRPSQRRGRRDRYDNVRSRRAPHPPVEQTAVVVGALEIVNGFGFIRNPERSYAVTSQDPFVPESLIRKMGLKNGQILEAGVGPGRNGAPVVCEVLKINGADPEEARQWKDIRDLTSIAPTQRLRLETESDLISTRLVELITPIGMGTRGLLVAPPRSGKTILLQQIAGGVSHNHPDVYIIALLIDERPEELTEMQRTIHGEVVGSSLDQTPAQHRRLAKLVADIAARRVEAGENVLLIMDSITRMARAFNKDNVNTGRTLSGGLDASALQVPRAIFGSARNVEDGGSLTIIATALIDTGSRMDEHIYEEFKGTGNLELVLSRELANARMWPAVDVFQSGTRREELLFSPEEYQAVSLIRRGLADMKPMDALESLTRAIAKYPTNAEFLKALRR